MKKKKPEVTFIFYKNKWIYEFVVAKVPTENHLKIQKSWKKIQKPSKSSEKSHEMILVTFSELHSFLLISTIL